MSNPCELNDCIDPAVHDARLRMKLWPLLLLGLLALIAALARGCSGGDLQFATPSIDNPNSNATIADAGIQLSGTGEASRYLEILRNGVPIGGVTVGSDGNWSFTDLDAPSGDLTYTARHAFAGNIYDPSNAVNLTYSPAMADVSAPLVTGPADDVEPGRILLSGTGEPGSRIQILRDGEVVGETIVRADGSWNFALDLPNAGDYVISARAIDADGNVLAEGDPFTVTAAEPTMAAPLVIESTTFGDANSAGNGLYRVAVNFAGTGEAGSTVRLWAADQYLGKTTVGSDGSWTHDSFVTLPIEEPYPTNGLMEDPDNVVLSRAEGDTLRLTLADIAGALNAPQFTVTDADGQCAFEGTTIPNGRVRLLSNGTELAVVDADANGAFSFEFECPPGIYRFGANLLDTDGSLLARARWQLLTAGSKAGGEAADGEGFVRVVSLNSADAGSGDGASGGEGLEGNPAVGIILDASWSMRNPELPANAGVDRIDIAKESLTDIVNNAIPDGTMVALRSFGNIEGNLSCRTDLMYEAQPLDKAALLEISDAIEPQFDANTPIATSLSAMGNDMSGVAQPKIIILLTDGLETCEGDVSAAIQSLTSQGIEVRIDVVGVNVDDAEISAEFDKWAVEGGGIYYDARTAGDISDAFANIFERAIPVAYIVTAEDGSTVHAGIVGEEPVPLPAGNYTITYPINPELTEDVEVSEDATALVIYQ